MSNDYNDIALEAIIIVTGTSNPAGFATLNQTAYKCAYEAAKLQAKKFSEDLDQSYIEYLENNMVSVDI